MSRLTHLRRAVLPAVCLVLLASAPRAQDVPVAPRGAAIDVPALRDWLTYLASDELQGRQIYSEGLGLAAAYIAAHLRDWGVKPAGDDGNFFQTVRVLGVRTTSRSTITVEVNGRRRTFRDGEGFILPRNMGGRQTVTSRDVIFAGYGLHAPAAGHDAYAGLDARGKVVIWLGTTSPRGVPAGAGVSLPARSRFAIDRGAAAVIGPLPPERSAGRGAATPARSAGSAPAADFTTAQRFDDPRPPAVSAGDELLEFVFSGAPVTYSELKARAEGGEPLPTWPLEGVRLTFEVDPEYTVVSTRLTRNVVGILEGVDPVLKNTYVSFGAHYDHIGYRQAPAASGGGGDFGCPGQERPAVRPHDLVNNGADDDGSGTVALMGIARAFAAGPAPRRSLLFIWHTAEEAGLLGSRYNADHPVVPNDRIVAHLNMDMVGRNRCDRNDEANTVYLVGSDRISTDLHNLSEETNASMPRPLTLDYELNDPADPQSLYTRSDHYSYAAKGIPVIFYTTGLHRDYHYPTDEVDRIEFEKLARIARLVFLTGQRLANADRAPRRDHLGPRVGSGRRGVLEP